MSIALDDPRHGTSAGYTAGCRDACCRTAIAEYSKRLRTRQYLAGGPLLIDATGTKRRIRALMALGWTSLQIDAELGQERTYTANLLCGPGRVNRATAAKVAAVYDRLSMRLPDDEPSANRQVISRTRNQSRRKGWAPPLAWDDIDDPNESPSQIDGAGELIDEVAVERVLSGDWRLATTKAEKVEIVARWTASGGSLRQLELLTGWNTSRYVVADGDLEQVAS